MDPRTLLDVINIAARLKDTTRHCYTKNGNDVQEWIEKEKPYQHMTDDDKDLLRTIGTNINKAARSGEEDNATRLYDRLIQNNVLKEKIVVYRGVVNQDYERRLAKEHGLSNEYLYYNGYIFCSLNIGTYYWNSRKTRLIISLPAGTHYLYTGEYSNTPESNEIILDKNSILRIDNEEYCNGEHYMWLTLVKTDLGYKRIVSESDVDIPLLLKIYQQPSVSQFISISDNYFSYVTNTENVYFYKIYENEKLIGAIHLEKNENLLYMDILIFPEFQRIGFATRVIKDIQNDIFGLNYDRIEISIDESNIGSLKLFETAGFTFVSKEDELLNFVYEKD